MNRRDVLKAASLLWLPLVAVDSEACTLAPPPKGARLKKEVSDNFARSQYVLLVKAIELTKADPNGGYAHVAIATWLILHVWKGMASKGDTFTTREYPAFCGPDVKLGEEKIFYLATLGTSSENTRHSGGSNASARSQAPALDALVKRRAVPR